MITRAGNTGGQVWTGTWAWITGAGRQGPEGENRRGETGINQETDNYEPPVSI